MIRDNFSHRSKKHEIVNEDIKLARGEGLDNNTLLVVWDALILTITSTRTIEN
jgi:hypothetical protein